MFDSEIRVTKISAEAPLFRETISELQRVYQFRDAQKSNDITTPDDFLRLHEITRQLYKEFFPKIYERYAPLYHSLWKQRLSDVTKIDNIHQDRSIFHFSRRGYQARMINIWINLEKRSHPAIDPTEMGIFVVNNKHPRNMKLYTLLEAENTHFALKKPGQLIDNTYIAGSVIPYDTHTLHKDVFAYEPGTVIQFSSHLLHGTMQSYNAKISALEAAQFSRTSLTSVWVAREDLDDTVLDLSEDDIEKLYMARHQRHLWTDLNECFRPECQFEKRAIVRIQELSRLHCGRSDFGR